MPLRLRLIALVGLVLLISLACGSILVVLHAASSVRTELGAALDVGTNTIRNGYRDLAAAEDRGKELRRLVATFDGNRHVRASLIDAYGQTAAASELFPPSQDVPNWFLHMIISRPPGIRLAVPRELAGGSVIVLQTDPTNETGEVWSQSRDEVLVLAGFAALSALLIYAVVGRALRPLETLSRAFAQIGDGDYRALPAQGSPEVVRLADGFNRMTERLAIVAAQNQRLNERLLTLQAEERADLARDLHDEIGPLLFAVDMTAGAIERLAGGGNESEIPTHAQAIHDAVGRMQRHVRVLLGRLRPIQAIGLEAAIERLITFWRGRRPDIAFDVAVSIDEERIGNDLKETIYRVVQEGTSNAIRHGTPTRIAVAIAHEDDDAICITVGDDGVGMAPGDGAVRGSTRLGLIGMRERVMAIAGSLSIKPGQNGKGLSLIVRLPCESALEAQQTDTGE